MTTSLFDLYKIGVGPSSSHTMGPMRAACRFARGVESGGLLDRVARVQVDLFGSLALTGLGHATDRAVLLGLAGNEPAAIDPASIESTIDRLSLAMKTRWDDGSAPSRGVTGVSTALTRERTHVEAQVYSTKQRRIHERFEV